MGSSPSRPDKIYYGASISPGTSRPEGSTIIRVRVLAQDQSVLREYDLLHIARHSPTGMNWGYAGSGPSDLALSIMSDYFSDLGYGPVDLGHDFSQFADPHPAVHHYQRFKIDFVATWPEDEWTLDAKVIDAWLELQKKSQENGA